MRRTAIALALALFVGPSLYVGVTAADDREAAARERLLVRAQTDVADRLYCGMSLPGGRSLTQSDVESFATEFVEPRFPDGFTMSYARGAWMGGREDTFILDIAHRNDEESNRRMKEIAAEYARRFQQSAVLRVTVPARMEFIGP